jgi:hypothetical protein
MGQETTDALAERELDADDLAGVAGGRCLKRMTEGERGCERKRRRASGREGEFGGAAAPAPAHARGVGAACVRGFERD